LSGLQDPLYQGNTLVGLGVDETASTTAAGSKATATPVHEFSLDLKNNLLQLHEQEVLTPLTYCQERKRDKLN